MLSGSNMIFFRAQRMIHEFGAKYGFTMAHMKKIDQPNSRMLFMMLVDRYEKRLNVCSMQISHLAEPRYSSSSQNTFFFRLELPRGFTVAALIGCRLL